MFTLDKVLVQIFFVIVISYLCSKFLYLRAEYKNLSMLHNFLNGTKQPILHRGKKKKIILNTLHRTKNYIHRRKKIGSYLSRRTEIKNTPCFFLFFLSAASFLSYYYYERLFLFFYVLYHSDLYLCNFLGIVSTSLQNFHFLVHIWRVHPLCSSGIFVGFSKSSKQGT